MVEVAVETMTAKIKVVAISAADLIVEVEEEAAVEEITMTAAAAEEVDIAAEEVVAVEAAAAEVAVEVVDSLAVVSNSIVKIGVGLLCPMKVEVDFQVDLEGWL